jgi:hypothetical protein
MRIDSVRMPIPSTEKRRRGNSLNDLLKGSKLHLNYATNHN